MPDDLVLVTGGTGKVGRRVALQLQARGAPTRVASRSSDIRFDWNEPGTWDAALDGVALALLVPPDGDPVVAEFARRSAERGVRKLVLLSARGVTTEGYFDDQDVLAPRFLVGEDGVRSSGAAWSIVRPGWFAQNFSEGEFLPQILGGRLSLPTGDGAAAFIDAEDIASVVVSLLLDGQHDGEDLDLTGPGPVTVARAVEMIAEATGRDIAYDPITAAEYRRRLLAAGISQQDAAVSLASLSAIRSGHEAEVTDGVWKVLGREPRPFDEFVRQALADNAWS